MDIRTFFSLFMLMVFCGTSTQESTFYARSNRSIPLDFSESNRQCVSFTERDIVYNKIIRFEENKIQIQQDGLYEINAFVNINLVSYATRHDSLQLRFSVIKTPNTSSEEKLAETTYMYRFGNFDVAAGFQIRPFHVTLRREDEICLCITKDFGTFDINSNDKYHHIITPTGMPQIMGLRIKKED